MKSERIDLWQKDEYTYPMAFGFMPNMVSYLHEDEQIRPCMVVVPGGGYCVVSPTEGEIVAEKFYSFGYNCFVVTYTTNLLMKAPLKDQPLRDLSRAIRLVRRRAEEFHIDPKKVAICGFSAGSHLCASVCVHFADAPDTSMENISNRPDAAILSYPVITSGEKAHRGSFDALIGPDASQEELHYQSLETQVTPETPPCFLWHTVDDEAVPVENSYLFAEALKHNDVPYAQHIFSHGHHGLSLADEKWAEGKFGEPYCMEQISRLIEAGRKGEIEVPEELFQFFGSGELPFSKEHPYPEVSIWPELAKRWLAAIL